MCWSPWTEQSSKLASPPNRLPARSPSTCFAQQRAVDALIPHPSPSTPHTPFLRQGQAPPGRGRRLLPRRHGLWRRHPKGQLQNVPRLVPRDRIVAGPRPRCREHRIEHRRRGYRHGVQCGHLCGASTGLRGGQARAGDPGRQQGKQPGGQPGSWRQGKQAGPRVVRSGTRHPPAPPRRRRQPPSPTCRHCHRPRGLGRERCSPSGVQPPPSVPCRRGGK